MRSAKFLLLVLVLVLATLPLAPAGASAPEQQRLYFLAADTDYLYYGPDAADPELGALRVIRSCPDLPWGTGNKPCNSTPYGIGTTRVHQLMFNPAVSFEQAPRWSGAEPIRFRLALSVDSPLPYTVHLILSTPASGGVISSEAADEVAPGIWEGTLAAGGFMPVGGANMFGIRILTDAPRVGLTLETAGASWLDLPQRVPAWSVPELLAAQPKPSPASEYVTAQRSLWFNDDAWVAHRFTGDLRASRTFTFDLGRDAAAVYAWLETPAGPFVHQLVRERSPDARNLTTLPLMRLLRNGSEVAHGSNRTRVADHGSGRGVDTLATLSVAAGTLAVEVEPAPDSASDLPYELHVVAVEGERTLAGMRWQMHPAEFEPAVTSRTPAVAVCGIHGEPIPTTSAVSSFRVDVAWDNLGLPGDWTIGYTLPGIGQYGCSEGGTGSWVRFTVSEPQVWFMGAAPARDNLMASYRDTVFTMQVRFAYQPLPAGV